MYPRERTLSVNLILVIPVQFSNMQEAAPESVISVSPVQPSNAELAISVRFSGRFRLVRLMQFLNAQPPIEVRLLGNSTPVSPAQPSNAENPIEVRFYIRLEKYPTTFLFR
jgi:hypothetical protein